MQDASTSLFYGQLTNAQQSLTSVVPKYAYISVETTQSSKDCFSCEGNVDYQLWDRVIKTHHFSKTATVPQLRCLTRVRSTIVLQVVVRKRSNVQISLGASEAAMKTHYRLLIYIAMGHLPYRRLTVHNWVHLIGDQSQRLQCTYDVALMSNITAKGCCQVCTIHVRKRGTRFQAVAQAPQWTQSVSTILLNTSKLVAE